MKRLAVLAALAAGLTLQASVAFGQQAPDASTTGTQTAAFASQTNPAGSATDMTATLIPEAMGQPDYKDGSRTKSDEPKGK